MNLIRFEDPMGTYVLRDPEVVDSDMFGPCFAATYKMEGKDWSEYEGMFPLRNATLIEPMPEQLALAA